MLQKDVVPLHASTDDEHLHSPSPLFPDLSQNSPDACSAHESTDEVHLQTLFAASQNSPVLKPEQDPEDPHLHTPETQLSPVTLHVTPLHGSSTDGPSGLQIEIFNTPHNITFKILYFKRFYSSQ